MHARNGSTGSCSKVFKRSENYCRVEGVYPPISISSEVRTGDEPWPEPSESAVSGLPARQLCSVTLR